VFYAVKNVVVIAESLLNTAVEIPESQKVNSYLKCPVHLVNFSKWRKVNLSWRLKWIILKNS